MGRKFSEEFKLEAVRLVMEGGVSIRQGSKDLGIGSSTLDKWVRSYREHGEQMDILSKDEREELRRLRKENKTLKMEREILKKATEFFASQAIKDRNS